MTHSLADISSGLMFRLCHQKGLQSENWCLLEVFDNFGLSPNVVCQCRLWMSPAKTLEYSGVKLACNIKHMKYTMPSMRIKTFNSTHQKFGQQELVLIYKSKHCPSSVLSSTLWTGENKNRVVWCAQLTQLLELAVSSQLGALLASTLFIIELLRIV